MSFQTFMTFLLWNIKRYFEKSVSFFFFFVTGSQNCFFTYILQNDVFCVLLKKISHTVLECMRVSECWQNLIFWVNYHCKMLFLYINAYGDSCACVRAGSWISDSSHHISSSPSVLSSLAQIQHCDNAVLSVVHLHQQCYFYLNRFQY